MKLKFFTQPDDYNDYLFWRSQHHRYAVIVIGVMLASLVVSWIVG